MLICLTFTVNFIIIIFMIGVRTYREKLPEENWLPMIKWWNDWEKSDFLSEGYVLHDCGSNGGEIGWFLLLLLLHTLGICIKILVFVHKWLTDGLSDWHARYTMIMIGMFGCKNASIVKLLVGKFWDIKLTNVDARVELALCLFILNLEFNQELCRVDRPLRSSHRHDSVPCSRTVHPLLWDLNIGSAELLDLNDGLPGWSQNRSDQALADLDVNFAKIFNSWRWRRR